MTHPQPRRLASAAETHPNKTKFDSSFTSSSFPIKCYSNPTTATTTTTSKSSTYLDLKVQSFSTHQKNQNPSSTTNIPCCFIGEYYSRGCRSRRKQFNWCSSSSAMATQAADVSVPVPVSRRTRRISEQLKKEELEREVFVLHKMLDQEDKVRKTLEGIVNKHRGTATANIPSSLPSKTKDLVAELAMVEDEIARLEDEVSHLQKELNNEMEFTKASQSKEWKLPPYQNGLHVENSIPQDPVKPTTKWLCERMPFEAKALHFISKAIKGDYVLNGLNNNNGKMRNSSEVTTEHKETHGFDDQEKVSMKIGTQNPATSRRATLSPMRLPRHQTSKPLQPEKEVSYNFRSKSQPKSSPSSEENNQKASQPNKLSESIMKCLIFIYVRLLRASRAMELEKLNTVSRSPHPSISSRSFRVDMGLNTSIQKESKQQDPYGIFDIEDSIPRDIGHYKNLVRFTSSSLDRKSLTSTSSAPLLQKLRGLINNLQNVDLRSLTHQQKLAFWINMHNACIMHGYIVYGAPSSPEKLKALMNKATLEIGGIKLTAPAIEQFILRQPSSSNSKDGGEYNKEAAKYKFCRLESPEPNMIFALCCGTKSSPSVRIYTADGVTAELERSKFEYLQASIVVTSSRRLLIPDLLLRHMLDFAKDEDLLIEWICHQLPTSCSLRKLMVDCVRGHNNGKTSNIVEKMTYEFEFQYLLAV